MARTPCASTSRCACRAPRTGPARRCPRRPPTHTPVCVEELCQDVGRDQYASAVAGVSFPRPRDRTLRVRGVALSPPPPSVRQWARVLLVFLLVSQAGAVVHFDGREIRALQTSTWKGITACAAASTSERPPPASESRRAVGRLALWAVGPLGGWPFGRLAGWPFGRLAGWPVGKQI